MAWTERYVKPDAAGGADGTTEANAWTLAEAITNAAAGQRVNVKATNAGGTIAAYANTTTSRTFAADGTTSSPIWWRGYHTTIGDLDSSHTPGLPTWTWTTGQMVVSGDYNWFTNLSMTSAYVALSTGTISVTALGQWFHRCRISNTGSTGRPINCSSSGSETLVSCCDIYAANNSATYGLTLGGTRSGAFGNVLRGGLNSLSLAGQNGWAIGNVCDAPAQHGIEVNNNGCVIGQNSFYSIPGDGIRLTSGFANTSVFNNLFGTVTGHCVGNNAAAASSTVRVIGGAYHALTGSFVSTSTPEATAFEVLGSLASSPYTAAGTHDFSLASGTLARGAAAPKLFEDASYTTYGDLGAVQAQPSAGGTIPSANDVRNGVAVGATVGNLILPAVADVQLAVAYGTSGTQYTGTFAAPAVGDVQSGVGYGAAGTEYTGTFVVPDVSSVDEGVTYGAGGTEFTGTLVGGGGGGMTLAQLQAELTTRGLTSAYTTNVGAKLDVTVGSRAAASTALSAGTGSNQISLASGKVSLQPAQTFDLTGNVSGNLGGSVQGNVDGSVGAVDSVVQADITLVQGAAPPTAATAGILKVDVELVDGSPAKLLDGTAQGGTSTTITLATTALATTDIYKDRKISIVGGAGVEQWRYVTAYNGTTKVATVHRAWEVIPSATSQYLLGDTAAAPATASLGTTAPAGWINAASIASDAVAKVQLGLATPVCKRGVDLDDFVFAMRSSTTGALVPGLAVTSKRWNGTAFVNTTNQPVYLAGSAGSYSIDLQGATDLSTAVAALVMTASGAVDLPLTILTQP